MNFFTEFIYTFYFKYYNLKKNYFIQIGQIIYIYFINFFFFFLKNTHVINKVKSI